MKHDDERWQQALRALSVEGPAAVPPGLAARAAAVALAAAPPSLAALLAAEILRLAPRALVAGAVAAGAALVVAATAPVASTAAAPTTASRATATSVGEIDAAFTVVDDDELAARLFGTPTGTSS